MQAGVFVAVVGPSGAGKDSLISHAASRLAGDRRFMFVRRVITRDVDSTSEDHDCVSPVEFLRMRERGEFAVTWEAHGLYYGIPRQAADFVVNGGIAVANGSRGAIGRMGERFARVHVVLVTADREVLVRRIAERGREPPVQAGQRVDRDVGGFDPACAQTVIQNNGLLEVAQARFVMALNKIAAASAI